MRAAPTWSFLAILLLSCGHGSASPDSTSPGDSKRRAPVAEPPLPSLMQRLASDPQPALALQLLERLEQISMDEPWEATPSTESRAMARAQATTVIRTHKMRELIHRTVEPLRPQLEAADLPVAKGDAAAATADDDWLAALALLEEEERCRRISLVLIYTIWQLDTTPSAADDMACDASGILESPTDPTGLADRERASQAVRYARMVTDGGVTPAGCSQLEAAMRERIGFIDTPIPRSRRPLGFALEMCARPNPAHFVDLSKTRYGSRIRELMLSSREIAVIATGDPDLDEWYRWVAAELTVSDDELPPIDCP